MGGLKEFKAKKIKAIKNINKTIFDFRVVKYLLSNNNKEVISQKKKWIDFSTLKFKHLPQGGGACL